MKSIISYIALAILILVIPLVVLFVQNQRQTQLQSQAAGEGEIKFVEKPNVLQCTGTECTTSTSTVDVEIKAPSF